MHGADEAGTGDRDSENGSHGRGPFHDFDRLSSRSLIGFAYKLATNVESRHKAEGLTAK